MTHAAAPPAADWLVFGASGQIGYFLLRRLHEHGASVLAASRRGAPAWTQPRAPVQWLGTDLFGSTRPIAARVLVSAGPLDGLATWLERATPPAPERIVALSSTSVLSKAQSPDPNERALVARLRLAEETVEAWCTRNGCAWTILRPTLVYGCGLDRSLTPIARRARRWGWFPVPRSAGGLRQPVHADDVAAACLSAAQGSHGVRRTYALPGAECLPFGQMIGRVLDCLEPAPRQIELPAALLRGAVAAAKLAGGLGLGWTAALSRLDEDLAFDVTPAARDLDFRPRPFAPRAEMFEPPTSM